MEACFATTSVRDSSPPSAWSATSLQCIVTCVSPRADLSSWNWLNKYVIKPFPHTNGTGPAPPKLRDYLQSNHREEIVTTSTDVFGVQLPEAVASGLLNCWQPPSAKLTASRPRVTENDTTTRTMFVINKLVRVGSPGQLPPRAAPAAAQAKPTRNVLPPKRVVMHTTEQNPVVMGTRPFLANACVSMTRIPLR